ncbi:MAG: nucleoside deaminase [Acholeplasmatales bacterium]|nr:MAG: nucleoside deaminase [Acholeplasmatales bacterium]
MVMRQAIERAKETMTDNIGGPFGAAVVDEKGQVIALASNSVLKSCDPTAHAEVNAIRAAGKKLGTHDLSGCTIITTAYPCPMCLSAIIWANIKHVVYGCRKEDAEAIGFRDDFIYRFMRAKQPDVQVVRFDEQERDACLELFETYKAMNKTLY